MMPGICSCEYGCLSCDPSGEYDYQFIGNRWVLLPAVTRYDCPHPECGSHDEPQPSAVKIEGGQDYCQHPSCTWVEGDGFHFATAAEICFCGRLIREHTKEEAQTCLECLILNGIKGLDTEVQINEVMAYETNEVKE